MKSINYDVVDPIIILKMTETNSAEFLEGLFERCNTLSFYRETDRVNIAFAGFRQIECTPFEGALVCNVCGLALEAFDDATAINTHAW